MNVLLLKEFPMALGLLIVFMAWSLNAVINRTTATPYLEYQVSKLRPDDFHLLESGGPIELESCGDEEDSATKASYYYLVRLTNLSNTIFLKNMSFEFGLGANTKSKLTGTILMSRRPAIKQNDSETCTSFSVALSGIDFHPYSEYTLVIRATQHTNDLIVSMINSEDETDNQSAVIFKEGSFLTFLVKHESHLFILFTLAAMILIFVYLMVLNRGIVDVKEKIK